MCPLLPPSPGLVPCPLPDQRVGAHLVTWALSIPCAWNALPSNIHTSRPHLLSMSLPKRHFLSETFPDTLI